MAFKIEKSDWNLSIIYSPQWWIDYFMKFFSENEDTESIPVKRIFHFKKWDVLSPDSDILSEHRESSKSQSFFPLENIEAEIPQEIIFLLWIKDGDYYRIRNDILQARDDVLIHETCDIKEKYFFLEHNSFLVELEILSNQPIIIWWDLINSIPEDIFISIIDSFPTKTELTHYSNARITNILSEYLEWVTDSQNKYEKYLVKRNKVQAPLNSFEWIYKYELEKYLFIRVILRDMLSKYEMYNEKDWEKKILEIILIIFPKYIKVFHSILVQDSYTNPFKTIGREIDLALLDANFHLDIIEIKKPKDNDLISLKPHATRDNHVPMKNLSSTVMQVEKYIFHLNKWWRAWEKALSVKYNQEIKIINPKWILIIWRSENFSDGQRMDFEIIKRQYSNMLDIITYDDLLSRLDNIISRFTQTSSWEV